MTLPTRRLALAGLLALSLAPAAAQRPSGGQSTPRGQLAPTQVATLRRISEVYNSFREMNGRFTQVDGAGRRTTGRFYISKPGRIRFTYDRPSPLEIVADGTDVVVRDRRLNTQDLYPLGQTPLRYLTSQSIDLTRDARVVSVFNDQDMVSVTIEERGNFAEGQLTLYFDATNFQLRQWTIVDGRGAETNVAVSNVQTNQRNDPALFVIDRTLQLGR
jgi:outer membrane lipoprotein-sorting protein